MPQGKDNPGRRDDRPRNTGTGEPTNNVNEVFDGQPWAGGAIPGGGGGALQSSNRDKLEKKQQLAVGSAVDPNSATGGRRSGSDGQMRSFFYPVR